LRGVFLGVGYHFFVSKENKIFQARPVYSEGAHCYGFNTRSVGIGFYCRDTSSTGRSDRARIDSTRGLIEDLKKNLGDIPIVSHTYAQLVFISEYLKQTNRDFELDFDINVCESIEFERVSKQLNSFVGKLSSDRDSNLKSVLKKLKNCPGPVFRYFI
jgi:hypothetical protein